MSFTADIKEQIAKNGNDCNFCDIAELSAIIRICTTVRENEVVVSTENKNVADRISELFALVFSKKTEPEEKNGMFCYFLDFEYFMTDIADRLMLFGCDLNEIAPDECCKGAYIKGSFLGGGSVSDPKARYHLEFDTRHKGYANQLHDILKAVQIESKVTSRKGRYIVYLKDYENIADVLGRIGAVSAAMEIYNALIEKNFRNKANRQTNCEVANIEKIAKTASIQIAAIKKIQKNEAIFDKLPETLKEMAELRTKYPEDSLKTLGDRVNPPIGKSGVNHRIKRLMEIADRMDDKA